MGSNRLVIFLSTLLMSSSIFIGMADTDELYSSDNEDLCSTPEVELSSPEECYRECREGEPPKTCYYHFTLEYYTVQGSACQLCTPNNTNIISDTCQCVTADGVERTIMTVNRKLPGPSIQVCEGDKVVIDVANHIDGEGMSIHWHGMFQKGSQYYDGVPFLTQCPIATGNNFRYQYFAANEGTHFWHAHSGMAKMDGIHGSLIVRVPRRSDPNSKLYNYDLPNHVVFIVDWMHKLAAEHFPGLLRRNPFQHPDTLLINGRGNFKDPTTNISTNAPLAVFKVRSGYSYRFRIINAFCSVCVAELAIERHRMNLIATDGVPVKPVKVDTINSLAGERFDVVIKADQPPGCYHMVLRGLQACSTSKIMQLALICYQDGPDQPISRPPTYDTPLPPGVVLGPLDGICNVTRPHKICINQLRSARAVDKKILHGPADHTFYFEIDFFSYTFRQLFQSNTYQTYSVPDGHDAMCSSINNISFAFPPSPPLSQIKDIPPNQFCDKNNRPPNCGTPCACTQLYNVKLDSIVEIIFADGIGVPALYHPIHIHGHAFAVMDMGHHPDRKVRRMRAYHAREMNKRDMLCRNFNQPPYKDTVVIPNGGYVVLRFRADNPGYWLIHCHFLFHQLIGMGLALRVGEEDDIPPVPEGFPKCGNFLPPIVHD